MAMPIFPGKWHCASKRAFGVTIDTLTRMQASYDIVQTRKRGR